MRDCNFSLSCVGHEKSYITPWPGPINYIYPFKYQELLGTRYMLVICQSDWVHIVSGDYDLVFGANQVKDLSPVCFSFCFSQYKTIFFLLYCDGSELTINHETITTFL